jgi:Mg2+-importing ATPase
MQISGWFTGNVRFIRFQRKRLTVQVNNASEHYAITKGALNSILEVCDRVETKDGELMSIDVKRANILAQYRVLSADGYRVLGVAYKISSAEKNFTIEEETGMIFGSSHYSILPKNVQGD